MTEKEPYRFECPCGARYETRIEPAYECAVCGRVGVWIAEKALGWITAEEYAAHNVGEQK
jgi:hypothetical protein